MAQAHADEVEDISTEEDISEYEQTRLEMIRQMEVSRRLLRDREASRRAWRDREIFVERIPLRRTDTISHTTIFEPEEPMPETFPTEIEPEKECCVCQEETNLLSLGCRHTICNSCIRKLHQKTCPQCRDPIIIRLVRKRK